MYVLRAAALLALILPAIPVAAAPPVRVLSQSEATADCGPVSNVIGYLRDHYHEHVLWWGDTDGGVTMVVTQRRDSKTWTLLAVHDGQACMVSSGGSPGAASS